MLLQAAVLSSALIACSTAPPGSPGAGASAAPNVPQSEQCSMLGIMACKSMALLSSESAPTCSAFRARDGTKVETCGAAPTGAAAAEPPAVKPNVYPVHLAWSDNSDNESNFVIERCDRPSIAPKGEKRAASCAGVWKSVATVGPNTTSYVDNTAAANQTYIYRVKAINSKGSSDYTQEAVITTPPR
jgi:hypothetical protein